jgi:hypothetical protein
MDGHIHRECADHFGQCFGDARGQTTGSFHAQQQSHTRHPFGNKEFAAHGAGFRPDFMKTKKQKVSLPIGRTALLAFQMNSLRDECCEAADKMLRQKPVNEAELDECARLDDALAEAQRLLKAAVARIAYSRLKRRSQTK